MTETFVNSQTLTMSGTIESVFAPELDIVLNHQVQNVVVNNVMTTNRSTNVPNHILFTLRVLQTDIPIDFSIGKPITIKGMLHRRSADFISVVTHTHAPTGFIRYDGKIYQ